jgi:hypothetical protein
MLALDSSPSLADAARNTVEPLCNGGRRACVNCEITLSLNAEARYSRTGIFQGPMTQVTNML